MSLTELNKSEVLFRTDLEHYQHRASDFVVQVPRSALWVDCGLGKTASTLRSIADQKQTFMVHKVLVIAPKKVALETWPDEIKKWSGLFNFTPTLSVIEGTPKQRLKAARIDADIYTIGVDNLVWLVSEFRQSWPFDWVVLDESSLFKDHSTKRFKSLRKVLGKVDMMTQLTGTPSSKGLLNLWSQIYLLDQGERLGRTITAYRRKYFDEIRKGDYTDYVIKEGAEQQIYDAVRDLVFRLDGDDYLKMEPLRRVYHSVSLPDPAREIYKTLLSDLIVQMESDETVVAVNKAVLTNKLLQCANGAIYLDETEHKEWKHLHDAKLDKLEQIINENDSPVLVAYNFKHDLERLKARFPDAVNIKEPGAINRWNNGEISILLAHPASAGHGLNLQNGGNVMVWFGLNWSLELYQQFNARLRRKGQTKPVICHHLVAENTVDQNVLDSLEGKNITQTALLNAMKEQVNYG